MKALASHCCPRSQRNSPLQAWWAATLAVALAAWTPLQPVIAADAAPAAAPRKAAAVAEYTDLTYYSGRDADAERHRLDLVLPRSKDKFPVLFFVHGGFWMFGDKSVFGYGQDIARCFARQGIGVVLMSYRLSPGVKHPEHVKDVARAFAWTHKNIGKYGGDPKHIFACGHSAGGHLVSLLATAPEFLKAEGLALAAIKGVISVSGVYHIPAVTLNFGGLTKFAQALLGEEPKKPELKKPVAPKDNAGFSLNLLGMVFGNDAKACQAASPITHVKAGLPPFLLIFADRDFFLLPTMARDFAKALKKVKCTVEVMEVAKRDHESVMFDATTPEDPVVKAIRGFIAEQTTK